MVSMFKQLRETLIRHTMRHLTSRITRVYDRAKVEDIHFDIDTAIPCGLIINELVSNSLKYAFPESKGVLTITLAAISATRYELVISDDGVGLPDDFDLDSIDSLGLQLVQGLVAEQLGGTVEFQSTRGTTWTIRF